MRLFLALLSACCCLLLTVSAVAQDNGASAGSSVSRTEAEALVASASEAFISAQFGKVIELLDEAFGVDSPPPDPATIGSEVAIDALRMLAVAHLLHSKPSPSSARTLFSRLLDIDPNFQFVSGMVSDEAEQLLAEVRNERDDNGGNGSGNGGDVGPAQPIYIQKEVTEIQFWVNFVPFGVGQLQNGETGKAVFFLLTESVALGINVISFAIVEGLRSPDGLYTPENAEAAEALQTAQFLSLGAFAAVAVWGIIDAIYFYSPTRTEIRTLDGPPPELSFDPEPDRPRVITSGGRSDDSPWSVRPPSSLSGFALEWSF